MHRILLALIGSLLVVSCAGKRDPIDRVQPNYIDKEALTGEWHYQRTVVDVPASDGFTFVGASDFGGLSRVSFDIQEDFLFARRTTELIKGADGREVDGEGYAGEVIAAFRISKHFDIMRPYNATTGEELNIIEENSVDRPWHDRTYMRVDWSENLVHNYQLDFEAQSVESVPYFVQELDPITGEPHPDAPVFENGYFDITNKVFAKAGTIDFPGYGEIPLCWLYDFRECGASEYTIRHSFERLNAEDTYEAMAYKGKATELFGFFWTDRMVYDPVTGIRVQGTERYLNRHNIWERSYTPEGNLLPTWARTPKPIVFHVNRDFPTNDAALLAAARSTAEQWNQVFIDVVAAAGAELTVPRMFTLCENNPIQAGDPPECGAPGTSARMGDIRYSFIAYVPKYMTYGLLGLGPSNNDPETGEIISGAAYVYHHNNTAAYRTLDMIKLLNGSKNPTEFIDGVDLTEWRDTVTSNAASPNIHGLEAADTFIGQISNGPSARYWDAERRAPSVADEAFQREHGTAEWLRPFLEDMHSRRLVSGDTDVGAARLAALAGTEIEARMLDDELYMAMGFDPNLPITEGMKAQTSILRGGFAKFAMERERVLEEFAEKRNMYTAAMADDALMGLARYYATQSMSDEEILQDLRKTIYTAVITHEVGHALGLMHNFGGSDDAINYFDEYWQIRSQDGPPGPRLVDPITTEEIDDQIYNYAYSSIMDYAGRYTVDGKGLGKYDRAAMLFGYANKVEVFRDTHSVGTDTLAEWYNSDGDIINFWTIGPQSVHYTDFYNRMGSDLYAANNRELVDASELSGDFSRAGTRARVPYIYCSHSRYNLGDSCLTRDSGADSAERMQNIIDDINTWYILRSFPRGIIGSDNYNYVSRYYGRVYNRLKKWHDVYGLYKDFLPRFYTPAELATFYADPVDGWGTKTWAVQAAFNQLIQTILMPEAGGHDLMTRPDGSEWMAPSPYIDAQADLDVSQARYFSTSWWSDNRECGYTWWECLHHVGFYLDKIMALVALTDSDTNFVGRSTPEDIREWQVSYYNSYAPQIAAISEAITAENWDAVAPYMDGSTLRFPNYGGDLTDVHTNVVSPQATFTIQLYWQVLGKALFMSNFDQSFAEDSRLFEMGTGMQPDLDAGDLVTFKDPVSGVTYGALESPDHQGSGAGAVHHANMLLARSTFCDASGGTTTSEDDCVAASGAHTPESVSAQLHSYVELLKSIVQMDFLMHWGDPYHP